MGHNCFFFLDIKETMKNISFNNGMIAMTMQRFFQI